MAGTPWSLKHTEAVLLGWVAAALGIDAWLFLRGRAVFTDVLRTRRWQLGLGLLVAHVWRIAGPVDPFRAAARVLEQKK